MKSDRCCYLGTIKEFLNENEDEWIRSMKTRFHEIYEDFPLEDDDNRGQVGAWKDCFRVLQNVLKNAEYQDTNYIIFEYKLPYEGGRRPDVLIVSSNQLLVLEFKQWDHYEETQADQLLGYTRDFREYHVACRDMDVISVLVLTRTTGILRKTKNVFVRSPDKLEIHCRSDKDFNIYDWIDSDYQPLPSILEAARLLAQEKPLPEIRQAQSAGIPDAMKELKKWVYYAHNQKKFILAFVTGVPGAGKTLLGLKLVYDKLGDDKELFPTLLVSGNDPLVDVFQYMLESKCLVRRVREIKAEKAINKNVVVFDEGQRAWDDESKEFIKYMSRDLDWGFLLILVGEGQSINDREHEKLTHWAEALKLDWEVVCPSKLKTIFPNAIAMEDKLDLTVSLRSHTAVYVSAFVNALVAGEIDKAKELFSKIDADKDAFSIYLTRNLDLAKKYCCERYEDESSKHYGIITSSKGSFYRPPQIKATSHYNPINECGPWYVLNRGVDGSGKNFEKVATEFACQGLELNMPIVYWNSDFIWNTSWRNWRTLGDNNEITRNYRINTYRVLLTRGRDGMIIYIPSDSRFNSTYELLKDIGIEELQ